MSDFLNFQCLNKIVKDDLTKKKFTSDVISTFKYKTASIQFDVLGSGSFDTPFLINRLKYIHNVDVPDSQPRTFQVLH